MKPFLHKVRFNYYGKLLPLQGEWCILAKIHLTYKRKIVFFLVDSRKKRNFATNKNKGD